MKMTLMFLIVVLSACTAFAAVGDIWSLSGDMTVAGNPTPSIDPPGSVETDSAFWIYHSGNPDAPYGYSVDGDLVGPPAEANGEVPDAGFGWLPSQGNHIMLIKFTVDADPNNGADKTNFVAGDVGGHSVTGATWQTDHAGIFQIDYLGYNGRNQAIAVGNELGRTTTLNLTAAGNSLDTKVITGGIEDGSANAYTNTKFVGLDAGDRITLQHNDGEWCGLDMTITEVAPDSTLEIATNPAFIDTVLPYANDTQGQLAGVEIPISAPPFVNCGLAQEYVFDHWVADSNVTIADVNVANTTATIDVAGAAQLTAHYVSVAGAPSCGIVHWDLSEDMPKSVDPNNLPSASNPVTVGAANWSYFNGASLFSAATRIENGAGAPTATNGEVPDEGFGWVNAGANWQMMMRFTVDADLTGSNGDKTSFVKDDVGGHTPISAQWETLADGWFQIQYGGYMARNMATAAGNEFGRTATFSVTVAGQQIVNEVLANDGDHNGSVNAFAGVTVNKLAVNDLVVAAQNGEDWAGLQLTIDKLEPEADLTIVAGGIVDTVTPFVGTDAVPINVGIPINAPRYIDCPNDHVLEFVNWVADSNANITDVNAASTKVSIPAAGAAQITAVYADDRVCGDECHPIPDADLSNPPDCIVNIEDLGIMSGVWLLDFQP